MNDVDPKTKAELDHLRWKWFKNSLIMVGAAGLAICLWELYKYWR